MEQRGLTLVYTGNGKGKTTAALGTAFRALGYGLPVCLLEFIKGNRNVGEFRAAEMFGDNFEIFTLGEGFLRNKKDPDKGLRQARDAWDYTRKLLADTNHHLVILDEVTYLLRYGVISPETMINDLSERNEGVNVILTGRYAPRALRDHADLVSEIRNLKHPFSKGIKARKGIEF